MGRQCQGKVKIKWSPNFAYAIGLITTDGSLSRDGRHIHFVSKDRELVEKLNLALGIKNKIGMTVRGGEKIKKYSYIFIGDKLFYQFLNSIGLYSAKSRTIKSVKISNKYFADFLRGMFDGDGTFYSFLDKRWPNSFGFQLAFSSASHDFIVWLKNKLAELYEVKGFVCKGAGVFNLRYVKRDSKKLVATMYYKNGLLHLNRKYIKIKTILSKDEEIKQSRKCRGSSVVELAPEERGVNSSILFLGTKAA